ncbi:MAG TPA: hypothetical protein VF824_14395 [Thermoanaerobaculia bacterium]|jgi:uncharacterized membrane protein
MGTYRRTPELLVMARRQALTRSLPLALLVVGAGVVIGPQNGDVRGLWLVVPILLVAMVFGLRRGYRVQRDALASLELTVTPERITRTMSGFPEFNLRRDEVVRITIAPTGALTLHAASAQRTLGIPAQIERRDELVAELAQWRAIEPAPSRGSSWPILAALLTIAAFVTTFVATNAIVVAVTGIALAIALGACAVLIWRNPQADARTIRLSFLVLLPLAAVIVKVVTVLR